MHDNRLQNFARAARWVAVALVWLVTTSAWTGSADAGAATKYYFLVYDIKLADGQPEAVKDVVRAEITRAIEAHPRLLQALPEGAPDPITEKKKFARYIERKHIKPFRIDIEVVSYEHEVEELEAPRRGQMLTVRMGIKLFGESLPKHTFGFTGEGSATIKLEIGKKLRKTDSKVAQQDAATGAAGNALTTALEELDAKQRKQKKKPRR